MRGIVWYETLQQGYDKLDEIIANYKVIEIKPKNIYKSRHSYEVVFENNDIWSIAPLCDFSLGKRCNVSYVPSYMKDSEEIYTMVYPSMTIPPYQAIHFYK